MTKNYICAEDAIEAIGRMMDIDGFRDGDCVSRRAVMGILDNMKSDFSTFIEKRLEETTGPEHYYLEKLMTDWSNHG